jgi:cytochrome c
MKKLIFIAIVLLTFSCKGKGEESVGKVTDTENPETSVNEGMPVEVRTPVALGESLLMVKGIVWPVIK